MSFEAVSQRLNELQETNRQLKDLIERLATIKFQPGSIPLKNEEDDSVLGELKSEIRQIIREQFDDFALLKEDAIDLNRVKHNSELQAQKSGLEQAIQRAENELKAYARISLELCSHVYWHILRFTQASNSVSESSVDSKRYSQRSQTR
jgi:protein transport protein SEC20